LNGLKNISNPGVVSDEYGETALLNLVLENLQVGYCVLDHELRFRQFNDRYEELLKCGPGEVRIGRPASEVLRTMAESGFFGDSKGDVETFIEYRLAEIRSKVPVLRETVAGDGSDIRLSVFPLSSGGVMVTLTDISDQKRVEKEKALKEDQLRRALDNIEGAVLMYDKDLKVQVFSPRYLEISNLPEGIIVVGESIYPVLLYRAERGDYGQGVPRELAEQRVNFLRALPSSFYQEQPMGDGVAEVYWARDEEGNLISVTNDITRRKQTERLLEDARLEAQAANKAKSEFLANMSHELRTPLNAVIGFSDSMLAGLTGELNERQNEYIQDISNSGAHLLALINDVLDLSKIEAGKVEVEETVFDIADVIDESLSLVREAATISEVRLNKALMFNSIALLADIRMMKQIMVNLLSNAVKFTPEGGCVTISSQRHTSGDLMISVSDTGFGMKIEEIPLAMKEFEQTETGKEKGGTGLGLPLTKNMVEMHGGLLTLISAPGKGTTATFSVPQYRIVEERNN